MLEIGKKMGLYTWENVINWMQINSKKRTQCKDGGDEFVLANTVAFKGICPPVQ